MQLAAAFLCDYAEVREGLLFALGGGITRLWRESLPAQLGVSVALLIDVHPSEAGNPHELQLIVQGPDGERLAEVRGGFQLAEPGGDLEVGESYLMPIALDLRPGNVTQMGSHHVEILMDGSHVRTLQFQVRPRADLPGLQAGEVT